MFSMIQSRTPVAWSRAPQVAVVVENAPNNAGDTRDTG